MNRPHHYRVVCPGCKTIVAECRCLVGMKKERDGHCGVCNPLEVALPLSLPEVEHEHIAKVLEFTRHNLSRAARILGVDRRTLYRKLEP